MTNPAKTMFDMTGKTVLVTGGSRGIGFAIGKTLGQAGATIAFNCRSEANRDKALAAYRASNVEAIGYVCDVCDETGVQAMVHDIHGQTGSIDVLVNNAASTCRLPMHEMPTENFKHVLDTGVTSAFVVSKAVLPNMMERRSGKIINICSMMSELGRPTMAAYASAKGAIKMLTRNMAAEYGPYGIQCNGLGPGYIATDFNAVMRETQQDGSPNPFDAFIRQRTPAGRWGTIDDLTGPALFLASSASDFMNGQVLYIDGGILAYLGR